MVVIEQIGPGRERRAVAARAAMTTGNGNEIFFNDALNTVFFVHMSVAIFCRLTWRTQPLRPFGAKGRTYECTGTFVRF